MIEHPKGVILTPLLIFLIISPKRLAFPNVCQWDKLRGILEGYFGEKLRQMKTVVEKPRVRWLFVELTLSASFQHPSPELPELDKLKLDNQWCCNNWDLTLPVTGIVVSPLPVFCVEPIRRYNGIDPGWYAERISSSAISPLSSS